MNPATSQLLQKKIAALNNLPAMPAVVRSLGECFAADPVNVNIDRVVELISYDKSLAAQCLRLVNSALFRRRTEIKSIRDAVVALGLQRVRDVVLSCSIPKMFTVHHGMAPDTFWRHALGTALVSQHLARRMAMPHVEKFYMAALLHDIGILVNSLLFEKEFAEVLQTAHASGTPLCEVEQQLLGFTHCHSGRILADKWQLPTDVAEAIEFHHQPSPANAAVEMNCIIYLADLLCRLRGLGYGYYEAREFDLAAENPWRILQEKHPAAAEIDLARFTFELDEHAAEVSNLVDAIFATSAVRQ